MASQVGMLRHSHTFLSLMYMQEGNILMVFDDPNKLAELWLKRRKRKKSFIVLLQRRRSHKKTKKLFMSSNLLRWLHCTVTVPTIFIPSLRCTPFFPSSNRFFVFVCCCRYTFVCSSLSHMRCCYHFHESYTDRRRGAVYFVHFLHRISEVDCVKKCTLRLHQTGFGDVNELRQLEILQRFAMWS